MKKLIFLILCILSFNYVYADSKIIITGDKVRIRDKASTAGNILGEVNKNSEYLLVNKNEGSSGNGCSSDWYIVNYNNQVGYVCSTYANIVEIATTTEEKQEEVEEETETEEEYIAKLKNLGFPDSYIPYLVSLHKVHPKWTFKVMNIDVDFDTAVSKENTKDGRSLIEDYNRSKDGLKSLESWSYNFYTDVFNNDYEGGGTYWFAASTSTIAYYMDPRNFLNEKQIFMFESQYFNLELHTREGITNMLKGTFMENALADTENNKTYVDAFYDGAVKYNISPYVLISRVIQEVGSQGSTIVSGTVSGYEGYYNFYNISAYGNTKTETIANGLKKAKSEGWDTPYKAVVGGAEFMVDGYLSVGQDTLYLNKWDFVGSTFYNHQYMQNIKAPSSESIKTYNAYKDIGAIENAFLFSIPVFKNMPDKTELPNSGNPNNYLSSLSINGSYLFESAGEDTYYSRNLSSTTESVEISASKVSSKATVEGTGTVSLVDGANNIEIKVTAENGDIRTYNIVITKEASLPLAISEILRLANINSDTTYLKNISIDTNVEDIVNLLKEKESRVIVTVTDISGASKVSGKIASGDNFNIKTSSEEINLKILLYGDINSDGKISSADYIKVKNHIMDTTKLSSEEEIYADANKDGKVSSADYIAIKNHIMGSSLIEQ